MSSVSVLLSSENNGRLLEWALRSILDQEQADVECVVVDANSTDGSATILQEYAGRLTGVIQTSPSGIVGALNMGFSRTSGEIMAWLRADEMLCPWACRTATTLFQNCASLEWVTTNTPIVWSRSRLCVSDQFADGFSRRTFLAGRNLDGSPYFHHPVERAATFWKRPLWERSGGNVVAALEQAGDFELWARFWESSTLACVSVPLGGRQIGSSRTLTSAETEYWVSAMNVLRGRGIRHFPSSLEVRMRRLIANRIPLFSQGLADRALQLWLNPEDEQCKLRWNSLV